MLEAETSSSSCFVTLTYRDGCAPSVGSEGSGQVATAELSPRHLQLFLKRLRKRHEPALIRYFAVGEYGPLTCRPHYHLALFGLGPEDEKAIAECWPHGFVCVLPLCRKSAQYVAGYVVEKLLKRKDPRLVGLVPEFCRMSRGLGRYAVPEIAKFGFTAAGAADIAAAGDVPAVLRQGQTKMPLGRFLRGQLRLAHGADSPLLPAARSSAWRAEMFTVRRLAGSRWRHRQVFSEDGFVERTARSETLNRRRVL